MNGRLFFSLISASSEIKPHHLQAASQALERNAADCARAWGVYPPAVVTGTLENIPAWSVPVLITDDQSDGETLAYHTYDPSRLLPAATAYVPASSGWNTGSYSLVEAIAHEICEALVDPLCTLWSDLPLNPYGPGTQVAVEVCDPVQTLYEIAIGGVAYKVANFVTPFWFDKRMEDADTRQRFLANGGKFDFSGELLEPGMVGPDGYLILRNDQGVFYGSAKPLSAERLAMKRRHGIRTQRRGVDLAPRQGEPDTNPGFKHNDQA